MVGSSGSHTVEGNLGHDAAPYSTFHIHLAFLLSQHMLVHFESVCLFGAEFACRWQCDMCLSQSCGSLILVVSDTFLCLVVVFCPRTGCVDDGRTGEFMQFDTARSDSRVL